MRNRLLSGYWAAPLSSDLVSHTDRWRELYGALGYAVLAVLVVWLTYHLTVTRLQR